MSSLFSLDRAMFGYRGIIGVMGRVAQFCS